MQQRGMTMAEIIISTAITGVILLATFQVMMTSREALSIAATEAELSAKALSIIDRIANDLKDAPASTVVFNSMPNYNQGEMSTELSFQRCMGFGASSMILSNTIKYELYDASNGKHTCRRTENGAVADIADSLPKKEVIPGSWILGLKFTGAKSSAILTKYDLYTIEVQLERENYAVIRRITVQLRNQ